MDTCGQVTRKLSRRGFIGLALGAAAGAHPLARAAGELAGGGLERQASDWVSFWTPELQEIASKDVEWQMAVEEPCEACEAMITHLGRPTPILDNLGITVDLSDAMGRHAGALGEDAPYLTSEQRREAALAAYLREIET